MSDGNKGYIGKNGNNSAQKVEAPGQIKAPKGESKVTKGNDLRTGKKKK